MRYLCTLMRQLLAIALFLCTATPMAFTWTALAPKASAEALANPVTTFPDVSPSAIAAFKADPVAFIAQITAEKGDLAAIVAALIIKDPSVLTGGTPGKPSPVAVASNSLPDQEKNFAKGVALAAQYFVKAQKQEVFTAIQTAVTTQFDGVFQGDFTNSIADVRTTAVGISSGAGGGAIGGLQTGGPNSAPFSFSPEVVKNLGPASPPVGVVGITGSGLITRTVGSSSSPTSLNSF